MKAWSPVVSQSPRLEIGFDNFHWRAVILDLLIGLHRVDEKDVAHIGALLTI